MLYQHLNLGIPSILNNLTPLRNDTIHCKLSILDLNSNFIKLIEGKGLAIGLIELFKLTPNRHTAWPIHVDGYEITDFPKMNFVYGNKQSPMIWYNVKDVQEQINPKYTCIDTRYLEFDKSQVEEAARTLIKNPTIVQAGVPHTVSLEGDSPRWVVSISFVKDFDLLSFDQLVDLFSEYKESTDLHSNH